MMEARRSAGMARGSSSSSASAIRRCISASRAASSWGVTFGLFRCTLRTVGVLLRDKCDQFVRLLFVEFVLGFCASSQLF